MPKPEPEVWAGMSAPTWATLGAYVRWMADRLWLRDWTITLIREPLDADDPRIASTMPVEGRKLATIRFARNFAGYSRDEIKNTVIHELIHLSHRDMTDVIRCVGNQHLVGDQAWDVWWETFRIATEVHVDSMANAFAAQITDDALLDEIIATIPKP